MSGRAGPPNRPARFLQVSTDEVYGSVASGSASSDAIRRHEPVQRRQGGGRASRAAYHETHGLDMVVTRGANTYGPYQHPEKLIPLFITNALDDEPLPMYGDGLQRRDWLFVTTTPTGSAWRSITGKRRRVQPARRRYRAAQPRRDRGHPGVAREALVARPVGFAMQGYAEFTMYSMNVDGLLGDVAHHAGFTEEVLAMPRCIYHLEHAEGSGWTPEGEGMLRKRLSESGADWLDASTVDLWSAYMDWLKRPMLFNGPDWGFGSAVLSETTLPALIDHT